MKQRKKLESVQNCEIKWLHDLNEWNELSVCVYVFECQFVSSECIFYVVLLMFCLLPLLFIVQIVMDSIPIQHNLSDMKYIV